MSTQTKPSIVFVHGLWADGSCFGKLIPTLQAEGHQVIAAQFGLDTLASDVAAVTSALGRVSSPAILVGHSYGGTLITAAGADPRVAGLVYICALAPDADETSQSLQAKFPVTDVFSHIEVADGRIWLKPDGIVCFAGDSPSRSRSWSGQPRACRFPISLRRRWREPHGGRSRAGSSWRGRTAPCTPSCNASSQNAWALPSSRPTAVTSRCCLSPSLSSTSSARPRTPFKRLKGRRADPPLECPHV
jgi:pimeloyl-ACP methyl ester carboxylesterase